MKRMKLLQVFEVDGITPKHRSSRWNYDHMQGKLFRELKPTRVGDHMMLFPEGEYEPILTTTVQAIDIEGIDMRVLTRNSIYHFELS
ncbi:hypothetical protein [Gordoniibacillus kamchatkensis]|uniref:hypothetical protein n=1 Tax=Gordoniibacillus kamchatkensis TaxID=1590651 RepID=UPI00069645B5|nr:hypothetical protein [Paenibacillus sp. VKM B-2647]